MNKKNRIGKEQDIINGIQKHLGNKGTLVVNGEKHSVPEIVAIVEGRVNATAKVAASRDVLSKDVAAERETLALSDAFMADLRQAILVAFGTTSEALVEFGIAAPKKRRALTAMEKVQRTAKANATRKLRGTMGPRKRSTIKAAGKATVTVTAPQPAGEPNGSASNGVPKAPG
jgi:hypothetical protein